MAVLERTIIILLLLCASAQAISIDAVTPGTGGGLDSATVLSLIRDSLRLFEISDVDSASVITSDFLVWNGSQWVGVFTTDTTFVFSIATFTENISNTVLIGDNGKKWLDVGGISFSATYNNGPPTVATVNLSNLPSGMSAWGSALDMGSPDFEGPTANVDTVDYPSTTNATVRFALTTTPSDVAYTGYFYFWNYIFYGADADSTPDESVLESLTNDLDNDHTQTSFSITGVSSGEHIIFAHPDGFSGDLSTANFGYGDETSDDGSYRLTLPMVHIGDVSVTNSAGKTENYDVYVSEREFPQNDVSSTLRTTNALRNRIKWGVVSDTVSMDEADIHALDADSVISNDATRTFTVTTTTGEYVAYAWPTRLGELDFYDDDTGFPLAMQGAKTIAVTNANGYAENYYLRQSTNPNLGGGGEFTGRTE